MPTWSEVLELLKAITSLLWPMLALLAVWKFFPVLRSVVESAKSRKFSIKIAGQELTVEEANQQNRSLIEDLEAKIIDLTKRLDSSAAPGKSPNNVDNLPKLELFTFSDDDLALQKTRLDLARSISDIIDRGLNEFSVDTIQQLIISQHNDSWRFHISSARVSDHIQEAEALYEYLTRKLIQAPPSEYAGKLASALGIMKHNMLGRIPGLRRREGDA